MSKIRSTYFMKDFADDDPRSVQAAIEGRDDGRSARYERYAQKHLETTRTMSVSEVYQAGVRAANGIDPSTTGARHPSRGMFRLATPVLGLGLGIALFSLFYG
ncbi:hypothetical protein [Thauera sp. 63]|uniref:hypothetical protein n=1 Tax=Thauera sp. 63 TaxID=497321 RepID=UPI0002D0D920|nr:hypothetical protein [Thauera sp. 63]ENO79167.1 hypothetical protein C664_05531 [Thauera sp. 63]